jgi:hypothetical protein
MKKHISGIDRLILFIAANPASTLEELQARCKDFGLSGSTIRPYLEVRYKRYFQPAYNVAKNAFRYSLNSNGFQRLRLIQSITRIKLEIETDGPTYKALLSCMDVFFRLHIGQLNPISDEIVMQHPDLSYDVASSIREMVEQVGRILPQTGIRDNRVPEHAKAIYDLYASMRFQTDSGNSCWKNPPCKPVSTAHSTVKVSFKK